MNLLDYYLMDEKSCNSFCNNKYKILYLPQNVDRNKFLCG